MFLVVMGRGTEVPEYIPIFCAEGRITTRADLHQGDALHFRGVTWRVLEVETRFVGPPSVRLVPWPHEESVPIRTRRIARRAASTQLPEVASLRSDA